MKFVQKVPIDHPLKNIFNQHFKKFDFKHQQENLFLDDIRSFFIKKCQIEQQYSKSVISLCEEYMSKKYQKLDNESLIQINVPDFWKSVLEVIVNITEKKMASSGSIMYFCDIFEIMKQQKNSSNEKVVDYLNKVKQNLSNMQNEYLEACKIYCTEKFLSEKINDSSPNPIDKRFKERLKKASIDVKKFTNICSYLKSSFKKPDRERQIDLTKINCFMIHNSLNNLVQHYISSEIPQLIQIQSGNMNLFVVEFVETIFQKETETNEFIINIIKEFRRVYQVEDEENRNEPIMFDKLIDFDYLIQFDIESQNQEVKMEEKIKNVDNLKFFTYEYERLADQLSDLQRLLNEYALNSDLALQQLKNYKNNYKSELKVEIGDLPETSLPKFVINDNYENQKFLIISKNFEMKKILAKMETLELFQINSIANKLNNFRFTYEEISKLNNHLDYMLALESNFYSETLNKTVDKPFIEPDDYEIIYESWL